MVRREFIKFVLLSSSTLILPARRLLPALRTRIRPFKRLRKLDIRTLGRGEELAG